MKLAELKSIVGRQLIVCQDSRSSDDENRAWNYSWFLEQLNKLEEGPMSEGKEMVLKDGDERNAVIREPKTILEEARKAASALTDVLKGKPDKVMINGQQYLEFEDWQTLARFYGLTVKVERTTFIDYGGARGFESRAVAINRLGEEISAAEAMCLNDEEKWSTRTKYAYLYILKDGSRSEDPPKDQMVWEPNPNKPGKSRPKKVREKMADEPVPLFQLRSMAQTRACAKALRNVLAWVVVLAGYKPTPAEEMDGVEKGEVKESEEQTSEPQPNNKEFKPLDPPHEPKKPATSFIDVMGRERTRLGDATFLKILGANGYVSLDEITDRKKQTEFYKIIIGYPTPKENQEMGKEL